MNDISDRKRDHGSPWYREPWPWYLMFGPFVVIVAGVITAWIAWSTSDGLVTDDYYKEGLVADRTLARSREAERLGLEAWGRFTADGVVLRLTARDDAGWLRPGSLRLTLSHPTRAGLDQITVLTGSDGRYSGALRVPRSGHWLVLIEDDMQTWRLMGNVVLPVSDEVAIVGGGAAKGD